MTLLSWNRFSSSLRLLLFLALLFYVFTVSTAAKLVKLTPIKCPGRFTSPSTGKPFPAVFLSRGQLEVMEEDENSDDGGNSVVLCDVLPVLISEDRAAGIFNMLKSSASPSSSATATTIAADGLLNCVINRDNGVYDNLPYDWKLNNNKRKKDLYDCIASSRKWTGSPFQTFASALESVLSLSIVGLLLEVSDRFANNRLSIGGAVVVANTEQKSEYALSSSSSSSSSYGGGGRGRRQNTLLPTKKDEENFLATVTETQHLDEILGFSLALNMPIFIDSKLFSSLSVDARLFNGEKKSNNENTNYDSNADGVVVGAGDRSEMFVEAPLNPLQRGSNQRIANYFNAPSPQRRTGADSDGDREQGDREGSGVPPAWEIYDPKVFLSLSALQKRALLRASGVSALPRPRAGIQALDELLMGLMDEAVRGEVLRLQNTVAEDEENEEEGLGGGGKQRGRERGGGGEVVATNNDYASSARQLLLQRMGEALESGRMEEATQLRAEFARLTSLRADPTQLQGQYDRFLDQDDWYMEARRKAMQPKRKPS